MASLAEDVACGSENGIGTGGAIIKLKMNMPGSGSNLVFLKDRREENPEYKGRQRKGIGTKTVQPYESYGQILAVLDGLLYKEYYRDYALMLLGLATGLRISDLVRLRVGDVFNVASGEFRDYIDVQEVKTGKRTVSDVDEVLITEAARYGLSVYFDRVRGWILNPNDPLFLSQRANSDGSFRLTENAGWRIVKNATEFAGVGINAGSHTLRKTFLNIANAVGCASKLSGGSGMVLTDVMILARHSKLTTTLRYTTMMKSRLLSLRRGVSDYLMGKTKVKSLKMEYEWEDAEF